MPNSNRVKPIKTRKLAKYTELNTTPAGEKVRETNRPTIAPDPKATNTAERSHPIHGGRHN